MTAPQCSWWCSPVPCLAGRLRFFAVAVVFCISVVVVATEELPRCTFGEQSPCVLGEFPMTVLNCLGTNTASCDLEMFCDLPKWELVKECFDEKECDGMFWEDKDCAALVEICPNAAEMRGALCPLPPPEAPPAETTLVDAEAILRDLFEATNGPRWFNKNNWLEGNVCSWFGVTCSGGSVVTQLRLSRNGLRGPMPASIGSLASLTLLDLSENELSGDIAVYKPLTALTQLVLGARRLTTICVFPYQGPGMEDCEGWPDGGQLQGAYTPPFRPEYSGDFVATITNLPELRVVTLSGTEIFGRLDERLCRLTKLEYWYFTNTPNSTGYIPDCLPGAMNHSLVTFLNSNSQIGGTLPHAISQMQALRQLGLAFNRISGTIPPFSPNLMHFYINDNRISGPLPEAQPWRAPNDRVKSNLLEAFLAYTNNISGTLPASYAQMKNLKYLWLSDNKITGTIPAEWAQLDNMLMVAMDRNDLQGPLPSLFGSWHTSYTRDQVPEPFCVGCSLGFLIPDDVFPIKMGLVILRLRDNHFSGTIPMEVLNHPFLYDFELMNNRISGRIEDVITDGPWAHNMEHLNLQGNLLSGSLDRSALCRWQNLDILEVAHNEIGGVLPECIGNLTRMRTLRISHNRIGGTIPRSIGNMSALLLASLSNNELIGSVPKDVQHMSNLRNWNSGFNRISGDLYDNLRWFGDIPTLTTVNLESNQIGGVMTLFILFEVQVTILWPTLKSWNLANNRILGSIPFVFDQYVQEISYLNVEGNMMEGSIPNFPTLDVMLLARNPKMRTNTEHALPSFLRATDFMIRQDPTYACPVISGSGREMVVSLDPHYYDFRLCRCEPGYFGRPPECRPCLANGVCDGQSEFMRIPAGWFPTPNATAPVALIRCRIDSVSTESSMCNPDESHNFTCKRGYSGRLCALCEDGFYQKDTRCLQCPSIANSVVIVVAVFVAMLVGALLLAKLPRGKREAVIILKVLIVYMQFAGTFLTKTSLVWPSSLMSLNTVFDISNVNIQFFSCIAGRNVMDLNMEAEVWGAVIFICIALAIAGFFVIFFELLNWIQTNDKVEEVESSTHDDTNWDFDVAERLEEEQDNARLYFNFHRSIFETGDTSVKKMKPKFYVVRGVITLLKFLYLPITTSVLQLFQCEADPGLDNRKFMTFNPPRECSFDDPVYTRNVVFASVLLPFYTIGFPVFICVIAVRYDLREKVARNVLFFLFNDFRPGHALYILWQLSRQLILSVICVLVPKEANVTLTLLVIHFFLMVMVHLYFEPYIDQLFNFGEGIALTCLSLTLTFGLVNSQAEGAQQETLAAVLLLTQLVFLFSMAYAFLIAAKIIPPATAKKLPWHTFITLHAASKTAADSMIDPSNDNSLSNSVSMSGSFAMSPSSGTFHNNNGSSGKRGRSVLEIYGRGSKGELLNWLETGQSVLTTASRSTFAATSSEFDQATREAITKVAELQRLFEIVDTKRRSLRGQHGGSSGSPASSAEQTPAFVTPTSATRSSDAATTHAGAKYAAPAAAAAAGDTSLSELDEVEMSASKNEQQPQRQQPQRDGSDVFVQEHSDDHMV